MRCLNPQNVGFLPDGKTISWSIRQCSKEYAFFQLPCGKCLPCRLEYARSAAVRCVHESKMYEKNSFITLTYSDEHLKSPRLRYSDFQRFMKRLRRTYNEPIGVFVTGEYGDKKKRPHWHALLFNYRPTDLVYRRHNEHGDQIYTSQSLDRIWAKNDPSGCPTEVGDVNFHSAGYCARYAAKKLAHGHDQSHDFHPIHKRSSKHAIGKKFVERYYEEIFNNGYCLVETKDGSKKKTSIPKYYERWLAKHHPEQWVRYLDRIRLPGGLRASEKELEERLLYNSIASERSERGRHHTTTRREIDEVIINERYKRLKGNKGDF